MEAFILWHDALATVDGAVVLAKGLDLVGFGGVVKGVFSKEDIIARAVDTEGETFAINLMG